MASHVVGQQWCTFQPRAGGTNGARSRGHQRGDFSAHPGRQRPARAGELAALGIREADALARDVGAQYCILGSQIRYRPASTGPRRLTPIVEWTISS